jgi:hypothetical protein
MTTHMRTIHLTDETLDYESLRTGVYFESHRIDCSKVSLAPAA